MKRNILIGLVIWGWIMVGLPSVFAENPNGYDPEISLSRVTLSGEVTARVDELVTECRSLGITDEYDKAVWFHDWLTTHANYDDTFSEYGPEGVLLKGKGVCQSYALAYQLLLNDAGIENVYITSDEMNHAWNLVKLNGEWCHVDCTWDDPGTGGSEGYTYFGLSDRLIRRDHVWPSGVYPAAPSDQNVYALRSGQSTPINDYATFCAAVDRNVRAGQYDMWLFDVSDETLDWPSIVSEWEAREIWRYSDAGYAYNQTGFSLLFHLNSNDGKIRIALDDTGNMAQLESDVRRELAQKSPKLTLHDGDGDGYWNPNELMNRLSDVVNRLAADYGGYTDGSYFYSDSRHTITIELNYIEADTLPEPFVAFSPVEGSNFTFDGGRFSRETLKGTRYIMVYGQVTCNNTRALLSALNGAYSLLRAWGIQVLVRLNGSTDPTPFTSAFPHFYYEIGGNLNDMWSDLSASGWGGTSVTFPVVFAYDENGNIFYRSTGYVAEPLRLVALMGSGIPTVPECILVMPTQLTSIGNEAFMGNDRVTRVILPIGMTSIGGAAFRDCRELRNVVIPSTVTAIGEDAFIGCHATLQIECAAESAALKYALAHDIDYRLTA